MMSAAPKRTYSDPNTAQREASDPQACVWVNASAGSGKTSVLTKRVLRLLLQNVRPQKLLCLTYTRAGAAEMANRVTESLKKWAVCDDNALSADIARLQDAPATKDQMRDARKLFAKVLACPGGLRIRTIHSFCQEILSRFPLEAGLPPHFSLIENQELDVLNKDVLDGLLREAVEQPNSAIAKAFRVLAEAQGEHEFADVLEQVMHNRGPLSKALAKAGSGEALEANVFDAFGLKPSDTPERIKRAAMKALPAREIKALAAGVMKGTANQVKKGEALLVHVGKSESERAAAFDDYRCLILTKEMTPQSRLVPAEVGRQQPVLLEILANEAERMKDVLAKLESAETCATTSCVLQFGLTFANRLAQRKASRAQLDYEDLILFTENLLRRQNIAGWVQYKLDQGIDHILVDEAQDTSNAQWNIVNSLIDGYESGDGRTLFVVGDEKQSIFSFQNADPEAFLSRRAAFTDRLSDAGKALKNIQMNTSFRSAKAVLDAVDAVFAQPEALQGVSQEPIAHQSTRHEDGREKIGRVEVWPLLQKQKDDVNGSNEWYVPGEYEEEADPEVELAQRIALKIKGWLERREALPGEMRLISPGDIMILLRRRGRFADLMVRALKKNDVPVTGVDRMHLIQELSILDLLSMIRFVLLPEDDLNLAELLRSPLIGFSEEQLMAIAVHRKGSLWESLRQNDAGQNVTEYLLKRLAEADYSTPLDFLSRTLNAPCPADAESGRKALWARLGKEALDPIDELLNAAETFGQNHAPSLQNFLRWLTQTDTEIRRELDHSEGQVRILTVHASKGLEAPIVFLPDTAAVPRSLDVKNFQWADDETPVFFPHTPKFEPGLRLWHRARDKQMEEYRRLFYVAMTRASRRLYICGWAGKDIASEGSWYSLALAGLKDMHKAHIAPDADGPAPLIIYADAFTPQSSTKVSHAAPSSTEPLPSWAHMPISQKPVSVAPTPSRGDGAATPDAAFARGRIIHRLLQSLPDIDPAKRDEAVARFLRHPRHGLSDEAQSDIAMEVGNLIHNEKFQALFGPDSLAEAPLAGRIDGANVFRQVDRLCLCGNEVWIVDYKTNRPPPVEPKGVPEMYRQQLAQYKTLLSGIYPTKAVRCFLLWTYRPHLMEIDV